MTNEAGPAPSERPAPAGALWSAVVPVKRLADAKSRLAAFAGSSREALALAMATDTVTALLACRRIDGVVVVTDDPKVAPVMASIGAHVVADEPRAGLNPALAFGRSYAERLRPGAPVALVSADLPALRPSELDRVLGAAESYEAALVADAAGEGTTILALLAKARLSPAFGPGSRRRHRAAGAIELTIGDIETLRRDVDTPSDLRAAVGLGLGARTAAVLRQMKET